MAEVLAAVQALPLAITTDDPFGGQAQMAHLDAATVELAAKVFSTILADVAAGRPAQHTVANVRSMMIAATPGKSHGAGAHCSTVSRRLLPPGRALAA